MTDTPEVRRSGYDRLVAADPEHDAPEPDLTSQREHLLALIDEVPQRRRGLLIAAGVAAAAALVAGSTIGGIAIGKANPPVTSAGEASAAPAVMQVPVTDQDSALQFRATDSSSELWRNMAQTGVPGAGTSGWPTSASSTDMGLVQLSGDGVYRSWMTNFSAGSSVSADSPGTARGYRFDSTGIVPKEIAVNLARVFGIEAAPKKTGITWSVREAMRSSSLYVSTSGDLSWRYLHFIKNPKWHCNKEDIACQRNPPRPDRAIVEAQAHSLFQQLGVTADVQWETYDSSWGGRVEVVAWQVIDGVRTPAGWRFEYSVNGLESVSGFAAALVSAGDYPVLSPKEAIERSAIFKWRPFGPNQRWSGAARFLDWGANPNQTIGVTTRGGVTVVRVPATNVTLEGGTPTVVTYWQPGGETLLLPGYRFTGPQNSQWDVISVAESAVDFG